MTTLTIPDMSCGHCTATIEKTIKAIDPTAKLSFDLPAHRVEVSSETPLDTLRGALDQVGYPSTVE